MRRPTGSVAIAAPPAAMSTPSGGLGLGANRPSSFETEQEYLGGPMLPSQVPVPVTFPGPKNGYLYIRVLEAGNVGNLPAASSLCCGEAGTGSFCGCPGLCSSPSTSPPLDVSVSCVSLEHIVSTSRSAKVDSKTQRAIFDEELLGRTLAYCGADSIVVKLQAKGATLGEASLPLRAAVLHEASFTRGETWVPRRRLLLRSQSALSAVVSASIDRDLKDPVAEPYVDVELVQLSSGAWNRGTGSRGCSSVPPLLLAVEESRPQLVQAFLVLDAKESLTTSEQADCLTAAIDNRHLPILMLLLDRMKPSHQHLVGAIRLCSVEIVEALLQIGGAPLLQPDSCRRQIAARHARGNAGGRVGAGPAAAGVGGGPGGLQHALQHLEDGPDIFASMAPLRRTLGPLGIAPGNPLARGPTVPPDVAPARPPMAQPQHRSVGRAAFAFDAAESTLARRHVGMPPPTPLALACSLGDQAMVEALCSWAAREKVHLDPTAPLLLAQGGSLASARAGAIAAVGGGAGGAAGAGGGATGNVVSSPWWSQDEHFRSINADSGGSCFGDPPMVMAVRGRSEVSAKRNIIMTLVKYGFATDVRSPVDSWTPLLAAVDQGSLELVTTLLQKNARLSADRELGFTPLHLACQTGQWHLVPYLADAMKDQYNRVAAWGPSPHYVSLNVVDAYGRTALDIALLRYFADPPEVYGKSPGCEQKAVHMLRELIHGSQSDDNGDVVCGWGLSSALRFFDALPSSTKAAAAAAASAQVIFFGENPSTSENAWADPHENPPDLGISSDGNGGSAPSEPRSSGGPRAAFSTAATAAAVAQAATPPLPLPLPLSCGCGVERDRVASIESVVCPEKGAGVKAEHAEMMRAVRCLVRSGAQVRWLLQDILAQPQPTVASSRRGAGGSSGGSSDSNRGPSSSSFHRLPGYSPIEPGDAPDV